MQALCSSTARDIWEILLQFFSVKHQQTILFQLIYAANWLPLSFNFTLQQNTEASVFQECLARLMLQPVSYNPWVKEHKDYKELTEWPSTCIKLNPFLCIFVSTDSQVCAARDRAAYQGALSLLTYMKESWLNKKCDLFLLVTISFSKIIWS